MQLAGETDKLGRVRMKRKKGGQKVAVSLR